MRLCSRQECNAPAAWRVAVEIPAESDLQAEHPLRMTLVSMAVCNDHGRALEVQDLVSPEAKAKVTRQVLSEGKDMPDWDRARVVLSPVGLALDGVARMAFTLDRAKRLRGS